MVDAGWCLSRAGLKIRRRSPTALAVVRLRRPDGAAIGRLSAALGVAAPVRPNTSIGQTPRIFWLAPGEWMVTDGPAASSLTAALAGCLCHVAEAAPGRVVFDISGLRARDLLAKGISLDLHPRAFGADQCAQTVLAQTLVLLDRPPGTDGFSLYADISYAAHLVRWFEEAAREYPNQGAAA